MKKLRIFTLTFLLFFSTHQPIFSQSEQANLTIQLSGKETKKLSLSQLKSKLKTHRIKLFHYLYKKNKRYDAFALQDVLKLAYPNLKSIDPSNDISFLALDEYESIASLSKLNNPNAFLAYKDIDFPNWEPIESNQANPGPFFLIWKGRKHTNKDGYPWPYQVVKINLARFEEQYPEVFPHKAPLKSAVFKGYSIFKNRCIACHSMNKQGGKIGPDLNAPQSIVAYRSRKMIKAYIKQPSKYRYTKMPDHRDLSETDLNALVDFFQYKSKQRGKKF